MGVEDADSHKLGLHPHKVCNKIYKWIDNNPMFLNIIVNKFQGVGSMLFKAQMGEQKNDVVIKIPIDSYGIKKETRFSDESKVFDLNIPYTVKCLGIGKAGDLGEFMILEPLFQISLYKTELQLIDIAIKSLIALRQLYKHGIPWICKLQHIMMDSDGGTKLVDFNDEPWDRDIPFFHHSTGEAIIMNGACSEEGIYKGKDTTPWSGWVACMTHLAIKNGLNIDRILTVALENMWAYEYQQLKNVHQPIYIKRYSHILRTETEKDDPNYRKLVPANRLCTDREKIIFGSLPRGVKNSGTWLDIGCNVGWFCFALESRFKTVGMEADKDMVEFAKMQGEYLGSDAEFINEELTIDSAAKLPVYDIISALSVIHWSLIKPPGGSSQTSIGEGREYFLELLKTLCLKTREIFYLEFPPYCYGALSETGLDGLIEILYKVGEFTHIEEIGVSDVGRQILRCIK